MIASTPDNLHPAPTLNGKQLRGASSKDQNANINWNRRNPATSFFQTHKTLTYHLIIRQNLPITSPWSSIFKTNNRPFNLSIWIQNSEMRRSLIFFLFMMLILSPLIRDISVNAISETFVPDESSQISKLYKSFLPPKPWVSVALNSIDICVIFSSMKVFDHFCSL